MKDSVERLKDKGNSALLLRMAESIGSVAESTGVSESVNVMNATVLNAVPGGETERPVSKVNRVFRIADNNDLFEVDRNAERGGWYDLPLTVFSFSPLFYLILFLSYHSLYTQNGTSCFPLDEEITDI